MVWLSSFFSFFTPQVNEVHFLLIAEQSSGYTRMVDAFENECALLETGMLTGTHKTNRTEQGWSLTEPYQELLSSEARSEIITLLDAAEKGPFIRGQSPCDIGNHVIYGRLRPNPPFPIEEYRDCSPSVENQSAAAKKLLDWVNVHCKFGPE